MKPNLCQNVLQKASVSVRSENAMHIRCFPHPEIIYRPHHIRIAAATGRTHIVIVVVVSAKTSSASFHTLDFSW